MRRATELAGGHAIAQVVAQEQFQRGSPGLVHGFGLALDLHPLGRRRGARRHEPVVAADPHHAHQAGGRGTAPFAEAQGGNVDAQLPRGIEHRRARGHFHFAMVDGQLGHEQLRRIDTSPRQSHFSGTHLPAGVAAGAFLLVDLVFHVGGQRDGVGRTLLGAERAADAIVGDAIVDQRLAPSRRAAAGKVLFVFVAKIAERGEHRVGGRSPQAADASRLDRQGQLLQLFQVARLALAGADAVEDVEHPPGADAAERTLAARLVLGEAEEVAGDIDHAVAVVQHHQAAGAHDRADLGQGFVVDGRVGQFGGNAAAGRAADLHGLEAALGRRPVGHAGTRIARPRRRRSPRRSAAP